MILDDYDSTQLTKPNSQGPIKNVILGRVTPVVL